MADGLSIDVSEINSLAMSLSQAAGRVAPIVAKVVHNTALDIEATSKQFAPVDTGALRNSIGTDLTYDDRGGGIGAEIGPTVEYGAFVEFGTSRQAPAAYMGPALDRHAPAFVAALEQLGGDVL